MRPEGEYRKESYSVGGVTRSLDRGRGIYQLQRLIQVQDWVCQSDALTRGIRKGSWKWKGPMR